jgi:uncharacterized membrane protein YgcG
MLVPHVLWTGGVAGACHRCVWYLDHDSFERTARRRLSFRRFIRADIGPTTLRTLQPVLTRATPGPPSRFKAPRAIPCFIIEHPPIYRGWWESLKVLFARVTPRSGIPVRFFSIPARQRMAGRPLAGSLILHGSFILFLIYLHQALPLEASIAERPRTSARIFYTVPVLDSSKVFPRIAPAGPGGRPGNASQPELPVLGSTALFTNLTTVSKPARPDNSRQTIWQRNSPPDLRIPTEVKLPMIAFGNPDIPKPKIKIEPNDSKPIQIKRAHATQDAPSESAMNSQAAVVPFTNPTVLRPALPLPAGEASKPVQRQGGDRTASVAPDIQAKGDTDLLVMSVDPGAPVKNLALPAGNRWGEFSASPSGGQPGSPAGIPNVVNSGGGSGSEGAGGDGSVGIGPGKSGGGGDSSLSVPVSLTGSNTAPAGADGLSGPLTTEEMIVPVVTSLHIRKNALVVAGGPMGGGGLGVYKALNCGKIYTVFIPMPGSNWSLEYCTHGDAVPPSTSASARTVVHVEKPLIPPDATVKFDFLRLPVSQDKRRKFIVLKGVIDEKGDVGDIEIYAGVLPAMDEAARAAFVRWKFMPALRDGKPVAVDILVGILPTLPEIQ